MQDMATKYIQVLKTLLINLENLEMFSNFVEGNFLSCETTSAHYLLPHTANHQNTGLRD